MTSLLSDYERAERHRAFGGIRAMAGFDYQLRVYLAGFMESLASEGEALESAGRHFIEALSDLAEQTPDDALVFIQVKRTLTRKTLNDAAAEVEAIYRFLQAQRPDMATRVKFGLVASQGDAVDWTSLSPIHPAYATVSLLLDDGRLPAPRIEADPWWRAVTAVWKRVKDPYGFLRFALERALGRSEVEGDAQRIRDEICERFARERQIVDITGQLLTSADFLRNPHPSQSLQIGREVTLARLRDQQYMPRSHRLDALCASILERQHQNLRLLKSEVSTFWLSGRSGVGKSVLLLQAVERLVSDNWRVLWLKGRVEELEPALQAIANAPPDCRPDFIAVDDLYDRSARGRLDIGRLGEFIDERDPQVWPMLLTCGPTEFAEAFKQDSAHCGFHLHTETLHTIAADEAEEVEAWYRQRTGHSVQRGTAVSQAAQVDGGLFISMAVELTHGDLKVFAQRFGNRVSVNGLDDALQLPLALNRLYLNTPYHWLSEGDREKLATLNAEGDFSVLEMGDASEIVRLTHPHLADALYRALRKPANREAYTNDLVAAFRRALVEQDAGLISQLLRVFSTREGGLVSERLAIVDTARLARECARAWRSNLPELEDDSQADTWVSWACWATTAPPIGAVLGEDLLGKALTHLGCAYKVWSLGWSRLTQCYPLNAELFAWAADHLKDPRKIVHSTWSLAWEYCLKHDATRYHVWRTMGIDWLQGHLGRPDWHIVWKMLLPSANEADWKTDPALLLGQRRLSAGQDGPGWAYLIQDLFVLSEERSPRANHFAELAWGWLAGREDRAEWSHVWRFLLKHADRLPASVALEELRARGLAWLLAHEDSLGWVFVWRDLMEHIESSPDAGLFDKLLHAGRAWLVDREDRVEWSHVWRSLMSYSNTLPGSLHRAQLLMLGEAWLCGREDQVAWVSVWSALLGQSDEPSENVPQVELLRRGSAWLDGREDRDEWPFAWRELLNKTNAFPADLPFVELLRRGGNWLRGRENLPGWAHVWGDLLAHVDTVPDALLLGDLLGLGFSWLKGHDETEEWSFVCEALLDRGFQHVEFYERSAVWLKQTGNKPEWPLLASKFIVASHGHPAATEFARSLEQRIHAVPNNRHWFKTEALINHLDTSAQLPEAVQAWLRALRERRQSPVWDKARRCLEEGLPVKGRVTATRGKECSVELEIGLMAQWANGNERYSRFKGQQFEFFVQRLNPQMDFVQVDLERPKLLAIGEVYEGQVVKARAFGLIVSIGGRQGLLHKNVCRDWESLLLQFPVGSKMTVEILDIEEARLMLRHADPKNAVIPKKLIVGAICDGRVTGVQEYGVFLWVGSRSGLLHHSELPEGIDLHAEFTVGQVLRVRVKEIRNDGKLALALPDLTKKAKL